MMEFLFCPLHGVVWMGAAAAAPCWLAVRTWIAHKFSRNTTLVTKGSKDV